MSAVSTTDWHEANHRYLVAALAEVRDALERQAARGRDSSETTEHVNTLQQELREAAAAMPAAPALERLCAAFGLSPFEREVLLLSAGMELDSTFAPLCAAAQGDQRAYPTFSLALSAFSRPHWSALTPAAPLRHWRLIEVAPGEALTLSRLRIDERVLHYLVGVQYIDERLAGLIEPVEITTELTASQRAVAQQLLHAWSTAAEASALPAVQLSGEDATAKYGIAAAACAALGLNLWKLSAPGFSRVAGELDPLIRLWDREAALTPSALLVDFDDPEVHDQARVQGMAKLVESTSGAVVLCTRERRPPRHRSMITLEVHKPSGAEQRRMWHSTLGADATALNGQVDILVSQFNLSAVAIRSAGADALRDTGQAARPEDLSRALWDACRAQTRPRLNDLAQRIQPTATWDDLVVPDLHRHTLRSLAAHVRQRFTVYETWGFAAKGGRGLGISALFAGASGTGKTMAAEVLANELRLDLYLIDLASVVSKYIGETEKNLRRLFDAAEEGGAILLFDEADALFGKRSEVRDSHDRYANIEISYLLQRMEAYRGLTILTTNMKAALDTAFLRRIRFIVQFPFPDAAQRAEIWRRIFPCNTPTEGLDVDALARLNLVGGHIRNIALNAAFLAADAAEPVRMTHLLSAARTEYLKFEKPFVESELGGWK